MKDDFSVINNTATKVTLGILDDFLRKNSLKNFSSHPEGYITETSYLSMCFHCLSPALDSHSFKTILFE